MASVVVTAQGRSSTCVWQRCSQGVWIALRAGSLSVSVQEAEGTSCSLSGAPGPSGGESVSATPAHRRWRVGVPQGCPPASVLPRTLTFDLSCLWREEPRARGLPARSTSSHAVGSRPGLDPMERKGLHPSAKSPGDPYKQNNDQKLTGFRETHPSVGCAVKAVAWGDALSSFGCLDHAQV